MLCGVDKTYPSEVADCDAVATTVTGADIDDDAVDPAKVKLADEVSVRGDELLLAVGDTNVGIDAEREAWRVGVDVSDEEPTWDADATTETTCVGVRVTLSEDDSDWDAVGE